MAPISYQTTSLSGTVADIHERRKRLIDSLGRFNGGLIALLIYYKAMGMSEENYRATVNVFKEYGRYRARQ